MNGIASARDLNFVAAMDREPRSILMLSGSFHLFHRLSGRFSAGVAIKRRAWVVNLFENSGIDTNVNARIRPRLLCLEHHANLAIAKLLPLIDQQSEAFRVGCRPQCPVVR